MRTVVALRTIKTVSPQPRSIRRRRRKLPPVLTGAKRRKHIAAMHDIGEPELSWWMPQIEDHAEADRC